MEELSPVSHTVGQIATANDDSTEDAGATPLAQPVKPCMAVSRRNKFQQRTDRLALALSFAGATYRIS